MGKSREGGLLQFISHKPVELPKFQSLASSGLSECSHWADADCCHD